MGIYACGLSHQIRVAYAKVDRMKQEIKFITFYKFYITETQTLIKNTGMMATLSGMEMGNATQAMTSIINGYKMSVEDTAHVVDTLVSIDNNAATSVEEIATALSRCSNTALEAGVSFDTLAGYAGTMSSVTRKSAETIGESLRSIMVK